MIHHYHGVPIFYRCLGTGPTLVLLHGFLESNAIWDALLPELVVSHQVVLIDLPGHGKSGIIDTVHSMEQMATIVKEVLDAEEIRGVTLVGHSMGGYVALAFLEQYPHYVNSFVLMNSTTRADSPERKINRQRALDLVAQNKQSFVQLTIPALFSKENLNYFRDDIKSLVSIAAAFSSEGIRAAISGMAQRTDRTRILKNYEGPKFIIAAKDDPVVPWDESQAIASETNSKLFELDGGHMSWLEQKAEVVKILHFIE
ncbi:MAG: alpha/beta hydrolase [Bacteroidia bacterium]|nr:alpha/beta hydrolase [Bacteroidia bacterium]